MCVMCACSCVTLTSAESPGLNLAQVTLLPNLKPKAVLLRVIVVCMWRGGMDTTTGHTG